MLGREDLRCSFRSRQYLSMQPFCRTASDNDTHCPPGSWKEPGMYEDEDNDGSYPDESPVEVR